MRIDICTLFPEFFTGPFNSSILRRALQNEHIQVDLHNPRHFTHDKHNTVDDRPFGGGPGMVMKPEPLFETLDSLEIEAGTPVIIPSPRAHLFQQQDAIDLSAFSRLVFLCGHYEGIDERVRQQRCTHSFSLGSYVLTGGEIAVLAMVDAIVRLIPGVVGKMDSVEQDSFMDGLLDCPHYTRPAEYAGQSVPPVLMGGNHAEIEKWRHLQKLKATRKYRRDLWDNYPLSPREKRWLEEDADL